MVPDDFELMMDPFADDPDPRFLYFDGARRNAFAQMLSAVFECKGIVLVCGERGVGKSVLVRHLADQLSALDSVLILYPGGALTCRAETSFANILAACRSRLDRRNKTASDEARLEATLQDATARNQTVTLLLDDAGFLDDETLVHLARLSEADDGEDRRLLSVVLAGPPGLAQRLERLAEMGAPSLIGQLISLSPFRDRDVERLIRHRLSVAGHAGGDLFPAVASAEIARRTRGNPRQISRLCAAALAIAAREMKSTVSREVVERAAGENTEDIGNEEPGLAAGERGSGVRADHPVDAPIPLVNRARVDETPVTTAEMEVAEAIRAADARSRWGGADPHIKYGPAFRRGSATLRERRRSPGGSAVDDGFRPGLSDRDFRIYPDTRPDFSPRRTRFGSVAMAVLFGLALAGLAAGGVVVLRSGWIDAGSVVNRVGSLAGNAVRTVLDIVAPEAPLTESTAPEGAYPQPEERNGLGLAFDRLEVARGTVSAGQDNADKRAPGTPSIGKDHAHEFAPPPPQVASGGAARGAPPVVPERTADQGRPPDDTGGGPAAVPVPDKPPEGQTSGADGHGGELLDPGTAVVMNRRSDMRPPAPPSDAVPPRVAIEPPAPPKPPAAASAGDRKAIAPAAKPDGVTAPSNSPVGATAKSLPVRPDKEPLLVRGDEYLGSGDLDLARTFYQMAYERGSAEAAIRMGWTYDPQYFQRAGSHGEASPREAILWYQEALKRGARQAADRLSDLATWLHTAAASGDVEAKRILELWQG